MLSRVEAGASFTVRRVEVVANVASGSVPADAAATAEAVLAELGLQGRVQAPEPGAIEEALRRAVDAAPDVLAIVAGDGTARTAAELCGPNGPVLAPLPGGTMNMLPRALYGERAWAAALSEVLSHGVPRMLGGGFLDDRLFLVAAIIGAPALWAPAREAMREGRLRLAALRAQRAVKRAFTGRLRYSVDGGGRSKTEALAIMCPLVSRAMNGDEDLLEIAALDPTGATEAFRLGLQAMIGDWRGDPSVELQHGVDARVWAAARIPALLDGESVRLERFAKVRYRAEVVQVLTLPDGPA